MWESFKNFFTGKIGFRQGTFSPSQPEKGGSEGVKKVPHAETARKKINKNFFCC